MSRLIQKYSELHLVSDGAGKTTVMAMLIVWQTINAAVIRKQNRFLAYFNCCTGITIKDRLRPSAE